MSGARTGLVDANPRTKFAARMRSILAVALAGSVLITPPHQAYATTDEDLAGGGAMGRGRQILPNSPRPPTDPRLGPLPEWDLSAGPASLTATFIAESQQVVLTWDDVVTFPYTGFKIAREVLINGEWLQRTMFDAPAGLLVFADQPPETGTYRYRVMAFNEEAITRWSPPTQAFAEIAVNDPHVEGGWTVFTPSEDTRIVYVSSSEGNDANDGLSEGSPKRTISAGYAPLRSGYPDWMLLKRGDVFSQTDDGLNKSGRSPSERLLIGSYGSSPQRPVIKTAGGRACILIVGGNPVNYLAIVGLELYASTRDPSSPDFILSEVDTQPLGIYGSFAGNDILIEDCFVHYCAINISISANAEVGTGRVSNLNIRRCVIANAYSTQAHSQGLFLSSIDNLVIDECVVDHNGWHETLDVATIFNHNMYLVQNSTGISVRNCIVSRGSATGIQIRWKGDAINNLCLQNPIAISLGHAQLGWPNQYGEGTIAGNVILDGRDITPQLPRGEGFLLTKTKGANILGNVFAHQRSGNGSLIGIELDAPFDTLVIRENTVLDWTVPGAPSAGAGLYVGGLPGNGNVVENNQFQMSTGGKPIVFQNASALAMFGFDANQYYSTNAAASWFAVGSTNYSHADWVVATGEANSTADLLPGPGLDRTIETYMSSLGLTPTVEAFIDEAKRQSKGFWRPEFTAAVVNDYIRAGLPPR